MRRNNSGRLEFDFERVARGALQSIDAVLARWVPDGKRQGHEYVALNPVRNDQRTGSFSVNINTGAWADFATGDKGGDLIALVAYTDGIKQAEACKRLAEFLRIDSTKTTATSASLTSAATKPRENPYKPVLPIPASALTSMPAAHPKKGKPSRWWDYRDATGLLFRVARFDGVGSRGKEYAPLSYGTLDGRTGWHWKALPTPRPLYRLDEITARADAPVLLCEGEKDADAAVALFPDYVVSAWPGGAQAINEADFLPLKNRSVAFWRDNDAAGIKSVPKLIAALQASGAATVSLISLMPFAQYTPAQNAHGEALEAGGAWPEKAGAADAVSQGWAAAHIALLRDRGELIEVPPKAQPAKRAVDESQQAGEAMPLYRADASGVFCFNGERYQFVCDFLEVIALARSIDGREWSTLVRFRDHDGTEKQQIIPLSLFAADGARVIEMLLSLGLRIGTHREAKRKLLAYLQWAETVARVRLVNKMGWHGPKAFMLPDRVIGEPEEQLHFYSESPAQCKISSKGTLAEWRDDVAMHAVSNPLLSFAISAAFAPPLLDLLGSESTGFHFVGDSSVGKSTLLKIAASVYGDPSAYPRTWRHTDNALESTAAAHSDCLLILDEIGQCDPRIIGETMYMLGNGEGKSRANERGGARDVQHRWRLVFLSSGEKTLLDHMAEAGKKPAAGMEMRFLTIPACLRESESDRKLYGIFNVIYPHESGAALSGELLQCAADNHGTAFPSFLENLIRQDRKKIAEWLLTVREKFAADYLNGSASGQAKRAADKFALVGAAGELAIKWGIVGWPEGEALTSAGRCFRAWLDQRGGEGNHEERLMIEQVRHHFETYAESRYTRWEAAEPRIDEHAPRTMERYGFRKTEELRDPLVGDSTESIFYVFPESFRREICKGLDYKRVQRLLDDLGALQKEKDRYTGKARLPGLGKIPTSCYIVKFAALCESEELDQPIRVAA